MLVEGSSNNTTTEVVHRERIWFFPHKFWQATKGMPKEEVNRLMAKVEEEAEAKNFDALRKYPFVFVGDPYKNGNAA
jgi:hypothetical protein